MDPLKLKEKNISKILVFFFKYGKIQFFYQMTKVKRIERTKWSLDVLSNAKIRIRYVYEYLFYHHT